MWLAGGWVRERQVDDAKAEQCALVAQLNPLVVLDVAHSAYDTRRHLHPPALRTRDAEKTAIVAQFQQKSRQVLACSKAVGHVDGERDAYQFLVSHRQSSHCLDSAVITVQLVPP